MSMNDLDGLNANNNDLYLSNCCTTEYCNKHIHIVVFHQFKLMKNYMNYGLWGNLSRINAQCHHIIKLSKIA